MTPRRGGLQRFLPGNVRPVSDWGRIATEDLEAVVPPRELWVGPEDPVLHFMRWVWEYRAYLVLLCGLRSDSSVLELGCNHGRTMLGLLDYLKPPGRYEGFDIMPSQIEFARREIEQRYPGFRFTLADIQNAAYNPAGTVSAETYRFPYDDERFDVAYAASVFTHLLPPASRRYLRESARVLRPGGRCLYSFFLLDYYKGKGKSATELYEFEHPVEGETGVAVHDPEIPEQVVGYTRAAIQQMANEAGLEVKRVLPGYWSMTEPWAVNEQDLVLLERLPQGSGLRRRPSTRMRNAVVSASQSRRKLKAAFGWPVRRMLNPRFEATVHAVDFRLGSFNGVRPPIHHRLDEIEVKLEHMANEQRGNAEAMEAILERLRGRPPSGS